MIKVSKKIEGLKPYINVPQDIWKTSPYKRNILKLDWNEGDFINESIKENIKEFLDGDLINYYPDVNANELINSLAIHHKIKKDNISIYSGSDDALDNILRVYIDEGDYVTYRNPEYSNFYVFAKSSGAILKPFVDSNPFVLNLDDFKKHIILTKPKVVYISNPNNPTGILYSRKQLCEMINEFSKTLFLIDEAYIHFSDNLESNEMINEVINYDNLVVIRTFSKLYSIAGLRIGYIVASRKIIENIEIIRKGKNVSMLSQIGAINCIRNNTIYMDYARTIKEFRLDYYSFFKEKSFVDTVYNSSTNFICIKVNCDMDILLKFLEGYKLHIRDRSQLHQMKDIFRITITTQKEKVFDVFNAFELYISKLR